MGDEYGNNFITVIDDDGNELELEHLDTLELDGELYMAFLPANMNEDDDDFGLVILKVIEQDDEEILATIDEESELNSVYERFIERLSSDEDNLN